MKKNTTLFLLCLLTLLTFTTNVHADSLGTYTYSNEYSLEDYGLYYKEFEIQTSGSKTHKGYNVELADDSLFEVVTHDLLFGDNAKGLSTVLEIAQDYEAKTGKVVYAAINGDYFSSGLPVDFYAKENDILRVGPYSQSLGKNSFGFDNDGNSIIGKVDYGYKIKVFDDQKNLLSQVHVDKVNEDLANNEIGVYTYNKKKTVTGDNIAKLDVRFDSIDGNYGFPFKGRVNDVSMFTFNNDNHTYSYKDFVIAAKGASDQYNTLTTNLVNDSYIEVFPYPVNDWYGMNYIIGGWQILMQNGNVLPEPLHNGWNTQAPRTSIGIKEDGTIGFTVTDGRLADYPGLTIEEQGYLQQELGYYNALELDGGGSSTLLLRNLKTDTLETKNVPSDGHLRSVGNAVLIVGDKIETEVEEKTCDEDPTQDKCQTEEPTEPTTPVEPTDENETPKTCEDGYTLSGDECIKDEDNTGCFGSIGVTNKLIPLVLLLFGILGLKRIRSNKFSAL